MIWPVGRLAVVVLIFAANLAGNALAQPKLNYAPSASEVAGRPPEKIACDSHIQSPGSAVL